MGALLGAALERARVVRPTGRGGAFIGVGLLGTMVAYATGWPALLAVSLFLVGAVAAAAVVVVLSPAEVTVERRIDPSIAEQRSPIRVRLSLRGRAAGALEWSEELPRSVTIAGRAAGRLPALRPDAAATLLEYEVSGRVRGAVPLGPLRVVRADPLRLVLARRQVGAADQVIVLPRIVPVDPPTGLRRLDPDARASAVLGAIGDQRDLVAREYRSGDPLRSVDWRATAHRGELMVRSESAASTASTGLVLDGRTAAWPREAAFERAVDYAASLVVALDERQAAVRFATGRAASAGEGVEDALVRLATARRSSLAVSPEQLVPAVSGAEVQIVHVVTGTGDPGALRRLPALPHGAEGLVTVVLEGGDGPPEVAPGWRVQVLAAERGVRRG